MTTYKSTSRLACSSKKQAFQEQLIRSKISTIAVIFLATTVGSSAIAYGMFLPRYPELLPNLFGALSLLAYSLTLLPGIIKAAIPKYKTHKAQRWLMKYRRYTGVASFVFALHHTVLILIIREIDMMNWATYAKYATGLISFGIMIILTVTSNNLSVKHMGKYWQKLHKLTYVLVFMIPAHLWVTMKGDLTHLTPISILVVVAVDILFLWRVVVEQYKGLQRNCTPALVKMLPLRRR